MTSLTPLTVETIVKEFETLGVKTFNGVDDEDLVPILDIVETVYDEDGNEMHITKWLTEKFTTLTTQHTKEKEGLVRDILALKINMPSEREYSTNPSSAYTTGWQTSVSFFRERIKNLVKEHNITI